MSDISEKFAQLRAEYPDDVAAIEAEEARVSALLKEKEYYLLDETQKLLSLCRRDIINARIKLSKERTLSEEARRALWHIIDARQWFVEMVVKDYDTELEQIESQLEAELSR